MIRRYWWLAGLLVAAALVIILAPLASSDPDGLERVAIDSGFAEQGTDAAFEILPDYSVPFLGDSAASLIVAGLVGGAGIEQVTTDQTRSVLVRRDGVPVLAAGSAQAKIIAAAITTPTRSSSP
mgnify:CR=1 FL=1